MARSHILSRILVVLLTTLNGWIGLIQPAAVSGAHPALLSMTFAYDGEHPTAVFLDTTTERGPPVAHVPDITYDAAGRWSRGAVERPAVVSLQLDSGYDRRGRLGRDARSIVEAAEHAMTDPAQPARSSVAAKSESRVLSDVEHLPCNCFVTGTKVHTADGSKPIEKIKVGDKVWAKNLTTGKNELRTVTGLFHKNTDEVMTITVANGAKVTVTQEHPFYVAGLGWIMWGDLKVGDHLAQRDGGSTTITGIDVRSADTTVYNFTVDGDHNCYVTEAQLLVHNCDLGASIAEHMGSRRLADVHGSTDAYIESVIHGDAPLAEMRSIGQSGRAIWRDGRNIIIRAPTSVHGGTAFSKPSVDAAIRYFEDFE